MSYSLDRAFPGATFDEIETRTRAALAAQNFGVMTEIGVSEKLKAKLDVDMPRYLILGACKPKLAQQLIEAEPKVGVMLPCNVVLREVESGVEVSAVDPVASMMAIGNPALEGILTQVRGMLEEMIAAI